MDDVRNLPDDLEIRLEWAEIYLRCDSCNEFELHHASQNWDYCPLCLRERGIDGIIKHKPINLLNN